MEQKIDIIKIKALASRQKKLKIWVVVLIVIISTLIIAAIPFWLGPKLDIVWRLYSAPYSDKWFAVYFQNGQVFYGQIRGFTGDTLKLENIYYLQSITIGDKTTTNLVKRGPNEITAPENYLMINRKQILYWEEIGQNSPAMKNIKAYQ